MGRKVKPFAATHYVVKKSGDSEEIIYLKNSFYSWSYWNDIYFDWYQYDYSYGNPISLTGDLK